MSGMNPIYGEHDPSDLRPELQPLPHVDWDALSSPTVQRVVRHLEDDVLEDVPGTTRLSRGVLALSIGVRRRGEIVPTVAGLVAFGLQPELVLPGMQVQVQVDSRVPDVWVGSLREILRKVGQHPVLREDARRGSRRPRGRLGAEEVRETDAGPAQEPRGTARERPRVNGQGGRTRLVDLGGSERAHDPPA